MLAHAARYSCRAALPRRNLISFSRNIVPYSVSSNLLAKVQINTAASAHSDHNHSKIWTAERFLSAGLVGLLPLSLAYPAPALDYALAVALTAHVHCKQTQIIKSSSCTDSADAQNGNHDKEKWIEEH
ncbi:succinate dehydrogenase [ubiquinone] cytochrome b small subunit A, mitochondrial-like [Stegodyphus dumicola]|uniref:succinate dehydrogenase [ubiquinone] cytochrome b small subunit A, mitochondrial-like n=1 Tax=Stegodyphus dumicola TaxID=202533 RepID=UPI0015B2AC14|nr:succinate dehydrogenase [ubiquinone] cytochrome b small subunit A, mitochondrial-like [Stegodyphus dumicola]